DGVAPVTKQLFVRPSVGSLPMSLGGGDSDVTGVNLTDAELARLFTTADGFIGLNGSGAGSIIFKTARAATTHGAGTFVSQLGAGPIVLDDQNSGTALDGNGGEVDLEANSGGIVAANPGNTVAEISDSPHVILASAAG